MLIADILVLPDKGFHTLLDVLFLPIQIGHHLVCLCLLAGFIFSDPFITHTERTRITLLRLYQPYLFFRTKLLGTSVFIVRIVVPLLLQVGCLVGKIADSDLIDHLIAVSLRVGGKRLIPLAHGRVVAHRFAILVVHLLHHRLLLFLAPLEVLQGSDILHYLAAHARHLLRRLLMSHLGFLLCLRKLIYTLGSIVAAIHEIVDSFSKRHDSDTYTCRDQQTFDRYS